MGLTARWTKARWKCHHRVEIHPRFSSGPPTPSCSPLTNHKAFLSLFLSLSLPFSLSPSPSRVSHIGQNCLCFSDSSSGRFKDALELVGYERVVKPGSLLLPDRRESFFLGGCVFCGASVTAKDAPFVLLWPWLCGGMGERSHRSQGS